MCYLSNGERLSDAAAQYFSNCMCSIRLCTHLSGSSRSHVVDLDRSNISNAYVSGMKEELHMFGTEFNVGAFLLLLRFL